MSRRPNFFLVRAPRCGTTAIVEHLRSHQDAFFCSPKEPRYFANDFDPWRQVPREDDYLHMFASAGHSQVAVGEGSTVYLYSDCAIQNILPYTESA